MFVDEATISISAGNGGNGSASFRREKFIPKGGPDGGDGGNGGNIYLLCKNNLDTLYYFNSHKHFKATDGEHGMRKKMHGKNGEDLYIPIPTGTQVFELIDGKERFIADVLSPDSTVVLAKGGKGGLGNVHFKSSTNQAPREFTYGEKGETKKIKFVLKLVADIGLVGLPNAGKSTLINSLTNSRSKIGDYPFTTITPHLGALKYNNRSIIIADIPGIIEKASEGKGLGLKFLNHIARTKMLLFLLDGTSNPKKDFDTLVEEIDQFDPTILSKPKLIIINKSDMLLKSSVSSIKKEFAKIPLIFISAKEATNLKVLLENIVKTIQY